jgi:hypothetical protein
MRMATASLTVWMLASGCAAAQAPADFMAGFATPGLASEVAEFVRTHPVLSDAPAPSFAAIRFDRIGASESVLKFARAKDGLIAVDLDLAGTRDASRSFAVALGGLLYLARTDTAQEQGLSDRLSWVSRIEAVEGRLFPLAPGNRVTVRYVYQEGWYFPGNKLNQAQRFGRWNVVETFEAIGPDGAGGWRIAQSCAADGTMLQDGRPIAPPPLWFCQAKAERSYSAELGWSFHPAVASPRSIDTIER